MPRKSSGGNQCNDLKSWDNCQENLPRNKAQWKMQYVLLIDRRCLFWSSNEWVYQEAHQWRIILRYVYNWLLLYNTAQERRLVDYSHLDCNQGEHMANRLMLDREIIATWCESRMLLLNAGAQSWVLSFMTGSESSRYFYSPELKYYNQPLDSLVILRLLQS